MQRSGPSMHRNAESRGPEKGTTARDPVCGMTVRTGPDARSASHGGTTYFFCGEGCRSRFEDAPERYLEPAGAQPAHDRRPYTCPMHPEVRQIGPGSCPICGMALEPVEMTAEEPANEELADMTRRFRVSVALTVPVVLTAMSEMV